jgi:biopolymer transport protein ExbB/TolQ
MRKKLLFSIGVLLSSLLIISCASEEVIQSKTTSFKFEKTNEMQNFEKKLRSWHGSKNDNIDQKIKTQATEDIEKATRELLVSLGKTESEFTKNSNQSTDEYVRIALKEYSKKLTEMYNRQNNK